MSNELKVAIDAARKGSAHALNFYGKELKFVIKDDNTLLTKADKEVEEVIKNLILARFPNANFVGEETGGTTGSGKFWVVDPIDGTRHFVKNTPLWATLISLFKDYRPVAGVSNMPCLNEILIAERGMGAFLNNKKIFVSKVSHLNNALLMYGSLRFFKERKEGLINLSDSCASSRSLVSPYQFHLLASGRCDIVVDAYDKMWDLGPFVVAIEEAGGKVTSLDGNEWNYNDIGCVATNGILHDQALRIINSKKA